MSRMGWGSSGNGGTGSMENCLTQGTKQLVGPALKGFENGLCCGKQLL